MLCLLPHLVMSCLMSVLNFVIICKQISWSPNCADPKYQHMLSPGGGFGPVAEDGYGVSYMVPGDSRIFFHVSSRRSGRGTNSEQFAEALKVTMADMIRLHGQNSG